VISCLWRALIEYGRWLGENTAKSGTLHDFGVIVKRDYTVVFTHVKLGLFNSAEVLRRSCV